MSHNPLWKSFLDQQCQAQYYIELLQAISEQRSQGIEIYPQDQQIYRAFDFVDLDAIKVVILGQDPYHGPNQAQGLAFSVDESAKTPPSLVNIYKALAKDIQGFVIPEHGDLTSWADQGVLLLNTVLTVQRASAHSHSKLGWERFTDELIKQVSVLNPGCVFMLWGSHAQAKGAAIDIGKHLVLESVHPSPLSAYRGFFECAHFSQANQWLKERKRAPINWHIEDKGSMDLF